MTEPSPTPRPRGRSIAAAGAVAVVLVTSVVAALLVSGDDGGDSASTATSSPASSPTITSSTLPLPSGGPSTTREPAPGSTDGASPFAELQAQVSEIRGLEWISPPDLRVVSKAELATEVRRIQDRDRDPEEQADVEALIKLLDLVPADLDYESLVQDLLAEQVLGLYDSDTKVLLVGRPDSGDGLDPHTRYIVAHELVHALTDQHFDFGGRADRLDDLELTEEQFALSALVEGDAVVTQDRWASEHLSTAERIVVLQGGGTGSDVISRTPDYLRASLYFPYVDGAQFVKRLINEGGHARVDAAYANPPVSSENIIHPHTYLAGEGVAYPAPAAVPAGCETRVTGSIGEFDTREMLAIHLDDRTAEGAAQGWQGDTFTLVACGSSVAFVDRWRGDTPADTAELAAALTEWLEAWAGGGRPTGGRVDGPNGSGMVRTVGGDVELVLSRDAAVADRVSAALG